MTLLPTGIMERRLHHGPIESELGTAMLNNSVGSSDRAEQQPTCTYIPTQQLFSASTNNKEPQETDIV